MIKDKRLPEGIISRIESAADILRGDDRIVFAYLFGGLAREGGGHPMSDVDMAVYLSGPCDESETRLSLYAPLTDALGTDEIDLVILNSAALSLAGRILMHRRVLVDKQPFIRHRYESITLRKYFDFSVRERSILNRRYRVG